MQGGKEGRGPGGEIFLPEQDYLGPLSSRPLVLQRLLKRNLGWPLAVPTQATLKTSTVTRRWRAGHPGPLRARPPPSELTSF